MTLIRDRLAPWGLWLASALLILHHLRELAAVLTEGVGKAALTLDFRTYMCGAADLEGPYDICHNGEFVSGFVYPPPSIIYFHALSRLPIDVAFLIHTALGLTALAAASWMLLAMSGASRKARLTALVATLAIAPVSTGFAAGQVNVLVMAFAVMAVFWAGRGRFAMAGIAIATGFWLKLYPAIIPALFLNAAKWKAALATCGVTAAMAVVALLWATPALFLQYFLELLPHAQGYTMPGVAASLAGIATHVEAGGGAPVLHFVPVPHWAGLASKALLGAGILAAMAHQRWTRDTLPLESLGLMLVAALVSAPNAWGYHYALVVPVLFAVLARALDRGGVALVLALGCWAAYVVPGWTDAPGPLAENPALNVLFRGRYAFAALCLAGLLLHEGWQMRERPQRGSRAAAF